MIYANHIDINSFNEIPICNICSESIDKHKIIGLACNLEKHIFCYDCIFDWYFHLYKKKKHENYNMINMCPICRKNGGLLPMIPSADLYIKQLHYLLKPNVVDLNSNIPGICGAMLKTKNECCKNIGKVEYHGFCGIHKKNHTTI